MRNPWIRRARMEPGRSYLAFASDIPPRSASSTGRLFLGAGAVQLQLLSTPGVVGFSLLARPFRKQYATLSVWESEEALAAFSHAGRHGVLMSKLAPEMARTTFVRWTIDGAEGRPSWREALDRLDAAPRD